MILLDVCPAQIVRLRGPIQRVGRVQIVRLIDGSNSVCLRASEMVCGCAQTMILLRVSICSPLVARNFAAYRLEDPQNAPEDNLESTWRSIVVHPFCKLHNWRYEPVTRKRMRCCI